MYDVTDYKFIIVIGVLILTILIIRTPSPTEKVLLFSVACIIFYYLFLAQSKLLVAHKTVTSSVDEIVNVIKTDNKLNTYTEKVFRRVIGTDPKLLKSLKGLLLLMQYDGPTVKEVLLKLVEFYRVYATLLLSQDGSHHGDIQTLVTKRLDVLSTLNTLYVSLPLLKYTNMIEVIILIIQSATYKCINVTRNKYNIGIGILKPPYASNILS
jgi:hypothetical protein